MAKANVGVLLKRMGRRLRKLRVNAGYSSYETFAVDHDLSRRYYWAVENGRNISIAYLVKILAIHDMTMEDFFKDLDSEP
jgi:transcriptional regulator with XRE-family HTH domain